MTTVRSQQKAQQIKSAHPDVSKDKLDFAIVEDISRPDGRCESTMGRRCPDFALAFDEAVISDPPFEAVIHTASPYHFNVIDTKKDLLDPGRGAATPVTQAMSNEFSCGRYYWYLERSQEKCAYGQKSCDHFIHGRNH